MPLSLPSEDEINEYNLRQREVTIRHASDHDIPGGQRRQLSVLPRAVWKRLGLRPKRAMRFELADGTEIRRQLSECRLG